MSTTARQEILDGLRQARSGRFPELARGPLPVDPFADPSPARLEARFIQEAEAVGVRVHTPPGAPEALGLLASLIEEGQAILGWHPRHISLPGLADWLDSRRIKLLETPDGGPAYGLTGVDAALATTGSLVLFSGPGKARAASLLPDVHIAIVKRDQIFANLESWRATQQTEDLSKPSNLVIISGPSRTADIGMQLVMGAHGPRRVEVLLID